MRLEKIILDGFKSFADKTEFDFDARITGIVGPNGCGKSNVVDAVKWVLGEQKLKSLRSDQMADVIFSGSGSRKPLGSAEVTLVLSNPPGSAGGRLPIDTEQVQISRRIYRSGDCEYRINGKLSRLKDVRELFMDTGVATRAYSIIEQGQVDQLVSASKQDRRLVFEEAAGISKYKAHKKEALRKLERTEQNLLRLADILSEVGKRLRSVKLQAGKARNYLEYSQRLKELQVNFSLVEYGKNKEQLDARSATLCEQEELLSAVVAQEAGAEAELSRLGNEILDREHRLSETGNSLVAIQSRIDQKLQRIEFLRSRIVELEQRKNTASQEIERLRAQGEALKRDLESHREGLAASDRTVAQKNDAIAGIQKIVQEVEIQLRSLQAELEDEKSGIIDIVRRTAQLHNEIQSLSNYRSNLSNQRERLAGRAQTAKAEVERLLTEKAQHNARLADIARVLEELERNLEAKRQNIEETERQISEGGRRLSADKEARSALSSELAVLADMERRYEGLGNAVKNIVRSQKDESTRREDIDGILAEKIGTDVQYAAAVEAALEGLTDVLLVKDTARLLGEWPGLSSLEGRVHFRGLDRVEPFVDDLDLAKYPSIRGRLVEFVRCDGRYARLAWSLLGKTLLVDSLDAALPLSCLARDGYSFVTLNGECLGADGVLRLGPLGKATGLISRRSRIEQLEASIATLNDQIARQEEQIRHNSQNKTHLEKLCKELRTAIYEASTEKTQVHSKLGVYERDIKRLKEEEPLIVGEIDSLEAQIAQSVQREYDSKQRLTELETVNNERKARIAVLEDRYGELRGQQQDRMQDLTDLKVQLGQAIEQQKGLRQIMERLQSQMQASLRSLAGVEEAVRVGADQFLEAQRDILSCEAAVSEAYVEKEAAQQSNRTLREQLETLVAEQKRKEDVVRATRVRRAEVENRINELRVELGQLQVRQQDLTDRVKEELQIDLAQTFGTHAVGDVNWEQVKNEIAELRGKIERLGNVNLDAIAEQDTLEERHNFLANQVQDLTESKDQLQQLIAKLNKQSRERFVETFEQIRTNFQQIFRKLFGGGKADIVLEESDDVLEAGIEVIAKPPGKETRSISLLSGGEKSMTAMALLFAVFRAKPSPFLFLDEVDAALDEANNERFTMLLRDFGIDSQFIVVTHSKRTMSVAQTLFGVTMQQQGVSKKIAVRFDEYSSETAAA
ncbi:MAG TPA: chromosome segregation protein SMC [Sedimentisphaerales bacterium]|jgi:chromosome segregation protein|nr:chromosome segregation protein SMC [Sedimentisphaerales bacterium]HNU30667.1 chromosome segregation protein SMC [Sedimentisphaerales bacterium]